MAKRNKSKVTAEVVTELAELIAPQGELSTDTAAVSEARGEADELPTTPVAGTQEASTTDAGARSTAENGTQAPAVPTLHVKQGLALRGGRGEWYKLLCKYDGKPVADYIAAGKAKPASHYTARSSKCGQPKTPESRLSWFKRAGIVTIS